jgi:type II restriction/modification system DNA methylase subunit YeeA
VFLTRILFCLFSEDTDIFERRQFQNYIEQRTNEDGSDLGVKILELFYILNSPVENRQSNLDEQLAAFPYVNGQVFTERLNPISLDRKARETLIKCCAFDWSQISASIFGSLFQGVMDEEERRELGAHYTSELNMMKVIQPLFLDELYTEFDTAKRSQQRLETFHNKLASLKFLDPACGCGNFLVTTYRELRKLELEVLKKKRKNEQESLRAFGTEELSRIHVNQFYGIEIEEFPTLVARTAMYLADHQATMMLREAFGMAQPRIPLEEPATIVHANALTTDWKEVVSPDDLDYILGNPPFIGAMIMSTQQRADLKSVFGDVKNTGVLDFVSAWYVKSSKYIQNTKIKVGLVSTNSITQGEQVSILWKHLHEKYGVVRHFAHQTFKWKNEAKGNAAVFCVIIGFSTFEPEKKYLYKYEKVTSEPVEQEVGNINAYLVDAPELFIQNTSKPICDVPGMSFGSMPRDGGNLIFTEEEKEDFIQKEPGSAAWIRPYTGAQQSLYNKEICRDTNFILSDCTTKK